LREAVASGVWKVVKSKSSKYSEGAFVFTGTPGWADYAVVDDKDVDDLPETGDLPKSTLVGALGFPGLTAYFGMQKVLEFQEGQTIIVSGAAGAVGNVVVQLAKNVYKSKKVIAIVRTWSLDRR
jgi:NADPH-dependent curcumin reductase CurA